MLVVAACLAGQSGAGFWLWGPVRCPAIRAIGKSVKSAVFSTNSLRGYKHHTDTCPDTLNILITAPELAERHESEGIVVVDCRFKLLKPEAGRQAWEESHVPGAYYADLDKDLAAPRRTDSGRHPLPNSEDFARLLGSWGITPATQVIVYDDVGGAVAARLWWLLRWVGHAQVSLLDGGYPAWLAAGHPVDNQQPEMRSGRYPVVPGAMPTIEVDEVATGLEQSTLALIDARDVKRFAGLSEPIDTRAGHIPGALNRPFQANLNDNGHFLAPADLRTEFDALLKGQEAAQLACMCGSGVTACHNVLAMELAGVTADSDTVAALYVGSWSEWIVSTHRPCDPVD